MKNGLENILVDCLCDTLHVMLCSESSGVVCTVNSLIERYPLFNFMKARSKDAMELYFRKIPSWHCLIIDSRSSFSSDFYTLVQELPYWVPIIVLSDIITDEYLSSHNMYRNEYNTIIMQTKTQRDTKKGDLIKKNVTQCSFNSFKRLFPELQLNCIKKKLMAKMMPDGPVDGALNVLFNQNPLTVEDWSVVLDSTPRKLQRMFKQHTDYSPKKLIALYHAYRIAFTTLDKQEDFCKGVISTYILDERSKKRVMEYVLSRRSQLLIAT